MSISFINKIRVLSRISPPLPSGSLTGTAVRSRGTVVAVEGHDTASVKTLLHYLKTLLMKDSDTFHVEEFLGPEIKAGSSHDDAFNDDRDGTVSYLDTISVWHKVSNEIVEFVTRNFVGKEASASEPTMTHTGSSTEDLDSAVSPKSILPQTKALHVSSPPNSPSVEKDVRLAEQSSVSEANGSNSAPKTPRPVALVPQYQLTTVDAAACAIPISDTYSAIDHWQWAATLWRGCVGPDITVYVRDCEKDEVEKFGGGMPVEVRLHDAKTIVVRRGPDHKEGDLDEKALRRVGFEVEEFLRK